MLKRMTGLGSKSAEDDHGKKGKRHVIHNRTDEDFGQFNKVVVEKSTSDRKKIADVLTEHYVFNDLQAKTIQDVVDVMKPCPVPAGKDIITQGDNGDLFYVMINGNADVLVDGKKVFQYTDQAAFGELSLMYSAPRAATIVAASECNLFSLDLRSFRFILSKTASSGLMAKCDFVKRVKLLQALNDQMVNQVASALQEETFNDGEYIITQGEEGDKFYIINEGKVKCTSTKEGGAEIDLITLKDGDYFGEMALMLNEPRHANCIAVGGQVTCFVLSRDNFMLILGGMDKITQTLAQQMRIRILKSVPLLAMLTDDELIQVANSMRVQCFGPNEPIIREGEKGERFYIINDGEVAVYKTNNGAEVEITRLSNQEYFGERALIREEPRKASIKAVGEVECLVLERAAFMKLLLPSADRTFEEEMLSREAQTTGNKAKAVTQIPFEELTILATIGTGTFGRVKLTHHKPSNRVCALKAMTKAQIVSSHQERNIMNEKNILAECAHPFVLEQVCCYQTRDELFILMEIVQGGELWTYIYEKTHLLPRSKAGGFNVKEAQFYAGCVISAFKYIHSLGVAYRDLKPENLLMDSEGYLKVIDFGFAKHIPFNKNGRPQAKSFTLCGTPEYLSPELVLSKGHDKSADYWALGCLIYELLVGHTPFQHDNQQEIFKRIIQSTRYLHFPKQVDSGAVDIVTKLLSANPAYRLGNLQGGTDDIMNHAWFKKSKFNWQSLFEKKIKAPYAPKIKDPLDTSNFDPYPEDVYIPPYTGRQDIFEGF
mmetsp:Transcript_9580/g.11597  ORF Transcript_9580/g.11597 Transcript_9580/m.11597 type:complete len:772 (+) Transcript_9580:51-2366(+)|eukprot:CAMPEP_0114333616 /NCGR_PEP_ID=MMETSP0101-20121206/3866_1 /TAXON_ID=38822 ORGANISM="Pteridomonas danica, Strain PT" /NCGR_SAMPLE_ID=MMETSP0101 /ASSEMBLY_ACC=CAM_ASM_000211 /LENGTH=771 /DNA_ID=CAMNT_0001464679 /DNA_START=57 /DNA_END=2372 /DNA_ORIENTATION=-